MNYVFPASRITRYILLIVFPFAALGVVAGFFWLHMIWGMPIPNTSFFITVHSTIMFYLVLLPFIMGVAYTLLPTFWNYRVSVDIAAVSIIFILIGEGTTLLFLYLNIPIPYTTLISILGAMIFLYYILSHINFKNKVFLYADLFIFISMVSLGLTLLYRIYSIFFIGSPVILGEYRYVHLFLTGFVIPLIYGVSVRTMKFKFTFVEGSVLRFSFLSHLIALSLLTYSLFMDNTLLFNISSIFFLISAIIYAYTYNIFETYPGDEYAKRMKSRDWIRYRYFTRHLNMAGVWLLTSYTLLTLYLNLSDFLPIPSLYMWDASLHSLTLGFIANFIYAYGGIMLPPIVLRKVAYKNLKYGPMILLNIGLALRVAVDIIGDGIHPLISMIHMLLILLSLIYFVYMMNLLFKEEVK